MLQHIAAEPQPDDCYPTGGNRGNEGIGGDNRSSLPLFPSVQPDRTVFEDVSSILKTNGITTYSQLPWRPEAVDWRTRIPTSSSLQSPATLNSPERLDNVMEAWKTTVGVQMHFNDLSMRVRIQNWMRDKSVIQEREARQRWTSSRRLRRS